MMEFILGLILIEIVIIENIVMIEKYCNNEMNLVVI